VVALFCAHGVIHTAANVPKGESWAFATLFLMLVLANSYCFAFYYDIACRFGPAFLKWAEPYGNDRVKTAAKFMRFVVPGFHVWMHKLDCALKCGPAAFSDLGCGHGEPPEQGWSWLRRLGELPL
jgi:hypothetical protein